MEILSTKNYSLFKFVMSNREVDHNHIKRLAKSIQRRNLLIIRPLIVDDKMNVIDGQHRLEAAKQIKAEVYYIKIKDLSKSDIAILNSQQKNWTMADFINFYALEGNANYKKLAALIDKYYWLKPSMVIKIASVTLENLKDGKIELKNYDRALKVFEWLRELEGPYPFIVEAGFTEAFNEIVTDAKIWAKLKSKIDTKTFVKCFSRMEYKNMIDNHLK